MAKVSRTTARVMDVCTIPEEEEEIIQAAVEEVVKAKGNPKKTEAAKKNLEKVVKKSRKVKMQDLDKAMQKAGVGE